MGTHQLYIPSFQKSQVPKTKRIFGIHLGKLEMIQFILTDKYITLQ